ncbi:MAG: o-succinylbenzoate--CoA ligase [Pseudanabaena sp. CAN_BIN31]|nr:o-succinylbenzoate--CoA ligase [Pseudanabaena sp. CAN_BIN31]
MKFPNWLSQQAIQKKETIAIIYRSNLNQASKYWTYAQLESEVDRRVEHLQILGIKSGDRVGLLLSNHPSYIMLVHALTKCEAIAVFLNIRLTAAEIEWQIENSQTKYLFCDEFTKLTANKIKNQIDSLIIADISKVSTTLTPSPSPAGEENINLEDIQGIFYTSGTTGKPKGVPLTYSNHFHSAIASALHLGVRPDDNWLLCMPLFHVGGLAIAWRSVINGTTLTLLSKFDEEEVLKAIATEKVTLISLVPTMLTRLLEHSHWQNLQKLRAILLGGAPASSELITQCMQLNLPIMPTYGMTETASQITTLLSHEVNIKKSSSGLPLFGNRLRIVDLDNSSQEMPIGAIGQIVVQGACVMGGYLHQFEQNPIKDGWLHTSDLGYLDRDGYLYVVSRRADLIISGGENIYPSEIEGVLLSHPAIAEACVIGIGDREWGEVVAAVIVANTELSLTEIRSFCEQKSLARYKLPKAIYIWESLPKTASGKLLRQEIRDRLES